MKADVLSIAASFGARSESWLYDQVAHLRRHRVHVLTYAYHNRDEYPHDPVTLLPPIASPLTRLMRAPLWLSRRGRYEFGLRERRCLAGVMRDGPGLIQAHYLTTGRMLIDAVAKYDVPFLVWGYGSDVFSERYDPSGAVGDLRAASAYLCCTSYALEKQLIELGWPAERIDVIHPGVDVPPGVPLRGDAPDGALRVISVGRLCDVKRSRDLVRVAVILHDRGVAFRWEHFGDGELRGAVEDDVRAAGLHEALCLRGEAPRVEVRRAMFEADVMVHPAGIAEDGSREALCVALVEGAAAGLPAVSIRIGGIPEVVRDGTTGCLVDAGDIEGMAACIERLQREPEWRRALGAGAHAYASTEFNRPRQAGKLDLLYDSFVTEWPGAPATR